VKPGLSIRFQSTENPEMAQISLIPNDPIDVLAVGAHPDDLEILCGGTLAKLAKQGAKVAILDLTNGEPTPRGTPQQREREGLRAAEALGVRLRFNAELPNRVLMDCPEHRYKLATWFRKLRPKVVLGIAGRTVAASPDHHQAQLLIEASRFCSQLTHWDDRFEGTKPFRVEHLVYAPFPFDAENRPWAGGFVVDVTDTWEQKLNSVRAYSSQFDGPRLERIERMLTGHAIYHGSKCGFVYGEPFALPTPVGTTDFLGLVLGAKGSPAPVRLEDALLNPSFGPAASS
jgi:bacillithiol biosynthesis deacetylase BshB1